MTILVSRVGYVPPMEPCLADRAPEGDDWIHELKYDGYRTQIAIDGDDRRAFTREENRRLAADAAAGAGDEGYFVLESHMRSKYLFRSQSVTALSKAAASLRKKCV